MTEYNEIREILTRWYQGESSPAEQRLLQEFFNSDHVLPDDLAVEREIFRAIAASDKCDVHIPENLADRIDAALRTEMEREHRASGMNTRWRRRLAAACGTAACLIAAITFYSLVANRRDRTAPATHMAVTTPAVTPTSVTLPDTAVSLTPEPMTKPSTETLPGRPIARKSYRKVRPQVETVRNIEDDDADMYLSEAEEERLIADNYRVVRDEREADAILNSVFTRLDCSLAEESYRMSDVNARYEIETTKLYN